MSLKPQEVDTMRCSSEFGRNGARKRNGKQEWGSDWVLHMGNMESLLRCSERVYTVMHSPVARALLEFSSGAHGSLFVTFSSVYIFPESYCTPLLAKKQVDSEANAGYYSLRFGQGGGVKNCEEYREENVERLRGGIIKRKKWQLCRDEINQDDLGETNY